MRKLISLGFSAVYVFLFTHGIKGMPPLETLLLDRNISTEQATLVASVKEAPGAAEAATLEIYRLRLGGPLFFWRPKILNVADGIRLLRVPEKAEPSPDTHHPTGQQMQLVAAQSGREASAVLTTEEAKKLLDALSVTWYAPQRETTVRLRLAGLGVESTLSADGTIGKVTLLFSNGKSCLDRGGVNELRNQLEAALEVR